jgi:hypothetical protein
MLANHIGLERKCVKWNNLLNIRSKINQILIYGLCGFRLNLEGVK